MSRYKKNYLTIYLWQGLSFILNFVSLFIVTPKLSSVQEIYGVYSVCAGLNIFLQYTDLGFFSAGKKFAAESIVVKDIEHEKNIVGTSMLIYVIFSAIISLGLVICVVCPDIIISGISNNLGNLLIARQLLLILLLSVLVTILHKYVEFVYSLRIEQYKIQQALIIGSIFKIASVLLIFFKGDRYDIVGYYVFCQVVTFLCCIYILYRSKEIGYGLKSVFNILHFDKASFNTMKGLAFGGFSNTISWILFYEIDTFVLSALLGPTSVAIYAVGRSIQAFVRSMHGIIYGPYNVRFYYFVGERNEKGLREFFLSLTSLLSITIIPIVAICYFAEPFIVAWVGTEYHESVPILILLVLCFAFNGIVNPCGSVVFAYNKTKELYIFSILQPLVFWLGVSVTVHSWGINSFAYFKLLACVLSALYWIHIATKTIKINSIKLMVKDFVHPLLIAVVCSYIVYNISLIFLIVDQKSSILLFKTIVWIGVASVLSGIVYCALNKQLRVSLIKIIKK